MASFLGCDACGAISPDKEGLHVANHWLEVKIDIHAKTIRGGHDRDYLICTDCMKRGVILDGDSIRSKGP